MTALTSNTQSPEVDPIKIEEIQTARQAELRAKRADNQAEQAENQADAAETQARRGELEIQSLNHQVEVNTKKASECGQKAEKLPELQAQQHAAGASAADKTLKAKQLEKQAQPEVDKHTQTAEEERAVAKKAKAETKDPKLGKAERQAANRRKNEAKSKAKEADQQVVDSKAKARKMEEEARKAKKEAKKKQLEVDEAKEAANAQAKHAAEAEKARAAAAAKQKEVDAWRELENARKKQAKAKRAEAEAVRAGDREKADTENHQARVWKAKAIEIANKIEGDKKESKRNKQNNKTAFLKPQEAPILFKQERKSNLNMKKHLSAPALLGKVYECFSGVYDQKQYKKVNRISNCDCLMSVIAIFSLKYSSLLQFDQDSSEGGCIEYNLKTLYGIKKIPKDTYLRERLDVIDPLPLRFAFKEIFAQVQRGKILEGYEFYEGHYLAAGDASGYFSSKKCFCANCCTKHHQDGSVSYYHQMMSAAIIHPDFPTVLPFCPEPIVNMENSTKNDCESKAAERLYRHIRREHPHLALIVTEDALGANGPHIKLLGELGMRYIIVVKPDGNKSLFEFLKGIVPEKHSHVTGRFTYEFQFFNSVPLNDANHQMEVNYLEARVYIDGVLDYHNTWITDIEITKLNVFRLYQGGRAKWKIENETFNTLKNQGYHFEHNYGHGYKNLSTVFAILMFLAFLIDQVQETCCGLFQQALIEMKSRTRLWGRMRAYFLTHHIASWEALWLGIANGVEQGWLVPLKRPSKRPLDTS